MTSSRSGIPARFSMVGRLPNRTTSGAGGSGSISRRHSVIPRRSSMTPPCRPWGATTGGKMLFLGLGTGLGSAMIVDGIVEPMELAHLPYKKGTFEDYVGRAGLERHGKKKWRRHVADVVARLIAALEPDDTVIGGGNAAKLDRCRRTPDRRQRKCSSAVDFDYGRSSCSPAHGTHFETTG